MVISMVRVTSSQIRPISRATQQVSPNTPPWVPRNRSRTGIWLPETARGVAEEMASQATSGVGYAYWVIKAGKETARVIRPTMAGLAKLQPMPPKSSLVTMMATMAPITGK